MNNTTAHVKHRLAIALRRVLSGESKTRYKAGQQFLQYLGTSPKEFRVFVQKRLQPEFTLSNHGKVWVLDHVAPLFLFDQTSEDDLAVCWNFINVIPMPLLLNRLKGVSLDFTLTELEIRAIEFPNNPAIAALKNRTIDFVRSMKKYHSKTCSVVRA